MVAPTAVRGKGMRLTIESRPPLQQQRGDVQVVASLHRQQALKLQLQLLLLLLLLLQLLLLLLGQWPVSAAATHSLADGKQQSRPLTGLRLIQDD